MSDAVNLIKQGYKVNSPPCVSKSSAIHLCQWFFVFSVAFSAERRVLHRLVIHNSGHIGEDIFCLILFTHSRNVSHRVKTIRNIDDHKWFFTFNIYYYHFIYFNLNFKLLIVMMKQYHVSDLTLFLYYCITSLFHIEFNFIIIDNLLLLRCYMLRVFVFLYV